MLGALGLLIPFARINQAFSTSTSPASGNLFALGIASGDPVPDGVVLWTRLCPDPLNGGGMPNENVTVEWEIGTDDGFGDIVQNGASIASPNFAHSVHVEVSGLEANRWYWYRFRAQGSYSTVGRTRTAPTIAADVERLDFAFVSCQDYQAGFFTAYDHLTRESLDVVLHLGDYIYEVAARPGAIRPHTGDEAKTLLDYRNRYALYKLDPNLQNAHALFPWIVIPDDHEVANDYAGENSSTGESIDEFLARRANAYQAYYEHLPLRQGSIPNGSFMQIYRSLPWGKLANFWMLDTRQFRSDQPCGGSSGSICAEAYSEARTMLGDQQEEWLFEGLATSRHRWNIIAQQVMMAEIDLKVGDGERFGMDFWNGYQESRNRLLRFLRDTPIPNPVVLTGDAHANWVSELRLDFRDSASPTIATEFVGTSITSSGDGGPVDTGKYAIDNSFVRYVNDQRGYVRCTVTPAFWRSEFKILDYVTRPGSPISTGSSFVIYDGNPVPQIADLDGDGLFDHVDDDDDNDGLPDEFEDRYGLNSLNPDDAELDKDSDGLTNIEEFRLGTDVNLSDTDGDGVNDGEEVEKGRNPALNEPALIRIIQTILSD